MRKDDALTCRRSDVPTFALPRLSPSRTLKFAYLPLTPHTRPRGSRRQRGHGSRRFYRTRPAVAGRFRPRYSSTPNKGTHAVERDSTSKRTLDKLHRVAKLAGNSRSASTGAMAVTGRRPPHFIAGQYAANLFVVGDKSRFTTTGVRRSCCEGSLRYQCSDC